MTPLRALRENHAPAEGGNGRAHTIAPTNRLPSRYYRPLAFCHQARREKEGHSPLNDRPRALGGCTQ
jgi:hypothetical protein